MRIFKPLIFISTLTSIFFIIYKQSNRRNPKKLWAYFKLSLYLDAILTGLINVNREEIKSFVNDNQLNQEIILAKRDSTGTNLPSNIGRRSS